MFCRILVTALVGILFGCVLLHQSSAAFIKCPSPHGTVEAVRVSDCSDKMAYCVLKKGSNATIQIDFLPSYNASSVKVKVFGEIAGVPVPFGVKPDEACEEYGLDCPLLTNETAKFDMTMPILPSYPPIPVKINIRLVDDTDTDMACIKFAARIRF